MKEEQNKQNRKYIKIGDIEISNLSDEKMVEAYHHHSNAMKIKYICFSVVALVVVVRLMFFKF